MNKSRIFLCILAVVSGIFLLHIAVLFVTSAVFGVVREKCKENLFHDAYYFYRHDIWESGRPPLEDCPAIITIPGL